MCEVFDMLNENLERIFSSPRGSAGVRVEKLPEPLVVRDSSGISCRAPWDIRTASKTGSLIKDEERGLVQMNSSDHIRMRCQRRCSPQEQYNSARQRHSIYTEGRNDGVPVRRTDGVDRAFPLKPIHHKRSVTLRTQDSLNPHLKESEKFSVSSQPRGHSEVIKDGKNCDKKPMEVLLLPQEHLSNGIRQVTGSQQPRRESHRRPNEQWRLANAIHMKELILQEKLWRIEEKIGKKIQRDGTAEGNDQKSKGERHGRRQAEQEKSRTETRASPAEQQRREPMRSRESTTQEDIKWQSKKQDEWSKDRRNTCEEERHRLDTRETEIFKKPQPNRDRRAEEVIAHERGGNGELSRWERGNVKENEQKRGKGRTEKHIRSGAEKGMTSQQEKETAKVRGQNNKISMEDIDWAREKKYNEQASKERYGSVDEEREQDMPQKGQQKSACTLATEKHSGKGRRRSGEPLLPPVSSPSPSSRLQHRELNPRDGADACLQLIPCKICHRKFSGERLEKHLKICKKMKQSRRKVFDSYSHRTKGTAMEEFLKSNTRNRSPEIKKSNWRQNHEVLIRNLRQGGILEPKPSIQASPDYVTCPHCSRQFAPAPAERHIPKCQHIKSRPPPPRYRQ